MRAYPYHTQKACLVFFFPRHSMVDVLLFYVI